MDHKQNSRGIKHIFTSQKLVAISLEWRKYVERSKLENEEVRKKAPFN
jgi:hypothetical protein